TSNNIVVSPNTATQLLVTTQPSSTATAGVVFSTQPVVTAEDAFNNVVTKDGRESGRAEGRTAMASVEGNVRVTLSSGVATFSGLSYNVTQTINLRLSTNAGLGNFTTTSNNIAVSPNTATQLLVTTQPSSTATAGVVFATQPVVTAEDAFNNVVT